jgi:hypothetical protein
VRLKPWRLGASAKLRYQTLTTLAIQFSLLGICLGASVDLGCLSLGTEILKIAVTIWNPSGS